jgi:hypothetical protein
MEVIFAFFAGWLFTWPALAILIVLGIIFEANDGHKMAVFLGLAAAVAAYFYFGLAPLQMVWLTLAYLGVGFIWSFYRYKRHCDKMVKLHVSADFVTRERVVHQLTPSNMLSKITMWVTIWPFSAVENIAGDLINFLQSFITRFFRGIYNRIFDNASAELLRNGK